MNIFEKTIFFIIFGVIFLVIFGVSIFIVNINHDFFQPLSVGMDPAFANELSMFQSAIMLLGVLFLIVGIINYFVGVSREEPDEYFRDNP